MGSGSSGRRSPPRLKAIGFWEKIPEGRPPKQQQGDRKHYSKDYAQAAPAERQRHNLRQSRAKISPQSVRCCRRDRSQKRTSAKANGPLEVCSWDRLLGFPMGVPREPILRVITGRSSRARPLAVHDRLSRKVRLPFPPSFPPFPRSPICPSAVSSN